MPAILPNQAAQSPASVRAGGCQLVDRFSELASPWRWQSNGNTMDFMQLRVKLPVSTCLRIALKGESSAPH